ncbi:TRAP transporter small permease subunit [Caldimonas thermodepolymerans]|jgi:TRAP-type C4-dicarboxylate transport system permease small subunit|uniref:TRAP transporter small permease protein n=1 Tax=Caldimonas thermodepolymerans TaxID=215580 RepID=A0A2S5T4T7_9BURK|nr:TRAP transporter small permease [Caldimonas thermodepolymerans]PPE70010.1 TRAP transporter permease DctQ [Caldimonas thermodepolymerans]QPC31751.1 TRAP transporter small permease subunit [Caldimonas thermodepolymerans]RDI01746.1 TRAP-type C4-dicarboxylate transport system permease small subunit [Caldimonas thermodepolymerans]TCP05883.1 TRAP-type C4-dicarboxylate transport system permease small subunit [Caldimonas thermodepolymerans]UZG44536.1 TRAP transporter small permease subunit [Caldimo
MRRLLDALYDGAAWLAALLMVGTLLAVLASMLDRIVTLPVRGLDAYAGYCMAGAGFLALAHTLKRGEHIRVTLLLNSVRPAARRVLELWCLVIAVVLSGAFAFYSARLVWESYQFNDISTGFDATPLWIPQLSMAVGGLVFFIAFVDELVLELLHKRERPASAELKFNE